MEENILKDFETFDEFPNKYMLIDKNSSYYYVKLNDEGFIAKRNIKKISFDGKNVEVLLSYYNVIDGSLILNTKKTHTEFEVLKEFFGAYVLSLNKLFTITDNEKYYLNKNDIKEIINFDKTVKKHIK